MTVVFHALIPHDIASTAGARRNYPLKRWGGLGMPFCASYTPQGSQTRTLREREIELLSGMAWPHLHTVPSGTGGS